MTSLQTLAREVRRLHVRAKRTVDDWLGGAYRSAYKGPGIAFEEVREYQPGDDVRNIDWNVTARMGSPFVKRFSEERERTTLVALDDGPAFDFGSGTRTKRDVAVETAAALSLAALAGGDRLALLRFGPRGRRLVPPRKGATHGLLVVHDLLAPRSPEGAGDSGLGPTCDAIARMFRRRCLVILVSDFAGPPPAKPLARLAQKHDVLAIVPFDAWERAVPDVGTLHVRDAQGVERTLDTGDGSLRAEYAAASTARAEALRRLARQANVDWVELATDGTHFASLRTYLDVLRRASGPRPIR